MKTSIDAQSYIQFKQDGKVTLQKGTNPGEYQALVAQYDPATGDRIDDAVIDFALEDVQNVQTGVQNALTALQTLVADTQALG